MLHIITPQPGGANLNANRFISAAMLAIAMAPLAAPAQDAPAFLSQHQTSAEDRQAIGKLLETYTSSLSNGDQAGFEAILLDDQVPFSGTYELAGPGTEGKAIETRHYQNFRKSVFQSGKRFTQHFYNVHIDQDGALAQVSLDFITQEPKTGGGTYGWKTLQLLKIQGQWKIASEFFTANALPGKS